VKKQVEGKEPVMNKGDDLKEQESYRKKDLRWDYYYY